MINLFLPICLSYAAFRKDLYLAHFFSLCILLLLVIYLQILRYNFISMLMILKYTYLFPAVTPAKHLQNSPPPLIMFTLGSVLTVLWLTPQKRNICLSAHDNSERKSLTLPFPLKTLLYVTRIQLVTLESSLIQILILKITFPPSAALRSFIFASYGRFALPSIRVLQ